MVEVTTSVAYGQRSLAAPFEIFPLYPPLLRGIPEDGRSDIPCDLAFRYEAISAEFFDQAPLPGILRWQALLPPLIPSLSMGEGGTPLVADTRLGEQLGLSGRLYFKDESRNPTWSHKDRLNLCTVSAAVTTGAPGVIASSSGNHGASAAAYAARAGLRSIVLAGERISEVNSAFLNAYGACVIRVPAEHRFRMVAEVAERTGFHAVSNLTTAHTGHPFGAEGYKTIAYELYQQLGREAPDAVIVPTSYGEMLFGVFKGFRELLEYGLIKTIPCLYSVEPSARAPLAYAMANGLPFAQVSASPTIAEAIAATTSGLRGRVALDGSAGAAVTVSDEQMLRAQHELSQRGLWQEVSAAAALAGLKVLAPRLVQSEGPLVLILPSSGLKSSPANSAPPKSPFARDYASLAAELSKRYGIRV